MMPGRCATPCCTLLTHFLRCLIREFSFPAGSTPTPVNLRSEQSDVYLAFSQLHLALMFSSSAAPVNSSFISIIFHVFEQFKYHLAFCLKVFAIWCLNAVIIYDFDDPHLNYFCVLICLIIYSVIYTIDSLSKSSIFFEKDF